MFNFPHIKYFIEWGKKNYRTFFPCEEKIDKLLSLIIKTDLRRLKMRSILTKNVSRKMNSTEQIVENTLTVRVNVWERREIENKRTDTRGIEIEKKVKWKRTLEIREEKRQREKPA